MHQRNAVTGPRPPLSTTTVPARQPVSTTTDKRPAKATQPQSRPRQANPLVPWHSRLRRVPPAVGRVPHVRFQPPREEPSSHSAPADQTANAMQRRGAAEQGSAEAAAPVAHRVGPATSQALRSNRPRTGLHLPWLPGLRRCPKAVAPRQHGLEQLPCGGASSCTAATKRTPQPKYIVTLAHFSSLPRCSASGPSARHDARTAFLNPTGAPAASSRATSSASPAWEAANSCLPAVAREGPELMLLPVAPRGRGGA